MDKITSTSRPLAKTLKSAQDGTNAMQPKKSFALVNYEICSPKECNPDEGVCAAVLECSHKVIKQIDGVFEPPILFQDICMGCWDCIEICQLDAIQIKHIS